MIEVKHINLSLIKSKHTNIITHITLKYYLIFNSYKKHLYL